MNTSEQGNLSESIVISKLLAKDRKVLLPFGDGTAYDLVYECNGLFTRVQVKTGRLRNGVILFKACSKTRSGISLSYVGKADVFIVYCPETEDCYEIPVEDIKTIEGFIRIAPTLNNQSKGIIFAYNYKM
jgi:hypothetical protein